MLRSLAHALEAARVWAVAMYAVYGLPVLILASKSPGFDAVMAVYGLAGGGLIEAWTHLVNDYFDFVHGVDLPGVSGTTVYRKHLLVEGYPRAKLLRLLVVLAGVVLLMAFVAAAVGRPYAVALAAAGLFLGYAYTGPPFTFKYRALGHVNLLAGWWLVNTPALYYMATGSFSAKPLLVSLPGILLVIAVLMGDNIRDLEVDRRAGVRTLEVILGKKPSRILFAVYVASAYAAQLALSLLLGAGMLLPLLSLPLLPSAVKAVMSDPPPPNTDPLVARLTLTFCALESLALWVYV